MELGERVIIMNGSGGYLNLSDLPGLEGLYFDNIWLKAYQSFFANLKNNFEAYRGYHDAGVFDKMADSALKMFRTLKLIKDGLARGYSIDAIRRNASGDYYDFEAGPGVVYIHVSDRRYRLSLNAVRTVRLVEYSRIVPGTGIRLKEASIYMELAPWLRIGVKPVQVGYSPPLIRLFYNPLIRTKAKMGLGDFGYSSLNRNFIDPSQVDMGEFLKLNHSLAFDRELAKLAHILWRMWFDRDDDLRIKASLVELAYDSKIPKEMLLAGLHHVGGKSKVVRFDYGFEPLWLEPGVKYYVTVKKGLQVKAYTKAWSPQGVLNRVEFTITPNEDLDNLDAGSLIKHNGLVEAYNAFSRGIKDNELVGRVRSILASIAECKNCEAHYAFLLDLLLAGQMKGNRAYADIAKLYRRKGLIRIDGRGKYSRYVINPEAGLAGKILDLFKEIFS